MDIITDWNEVPEWKERKIVDFPSIFRHYMFSEEILDEYLSIADALKYNDTSIPLLATKYLLHTKDWHHTEALDNNTTAWRNENIEACLGLDYCGPIIGEHQHFSINLVIKHPHQLTNQALEANPYLNFMPDSEPENLNVLDTFETAAFAYDIIQENLKTYYNNLVSLNEGYNFEAIPRAALADSQFLYQNNKIIGNKDKFYLLESKKIEFKDPEMIEIIYNSLETKYHKKGMETILNYRHVNEDFLERYYDDIKKFDLFSSVLTKQFLSEEYLNAIWHNIKNNPDTIYAFGHLSLSLSEDFIDKHAEDLTNLDIQTQSTESSSACWFCVAAWYAKTPEFVTRHAEQLKPYLFYLQRNIYLSKKYTEDEIQTFVEPEKTQKIMTDVQETILNTLKESGLSAKDALKILDNIKAKGNALSQAKENTAPQH